MKILYMLSMFPKISSEAFILNEIIELKKRGNEIKILADKIQNLMGDQTHSKVLEHKMMEKIIKRKEYKRGAIKLIDLSKIFLKDFLKNPEKESNFLKILFKEKKNFPKKDRFWLEVDSYLNFKQLLSEKIDVIYSPFGTFEKLEKGLLLSKLLKAPLIMSFRALELYEKNSREEIIKNKDLFKRVDKILTISEFNKNELEELISKKKKIEIIRSSTDLEKFNPENKKKNKKIKNKIITIARFKEKKGIAYLIEALAILKEKNIKFNFTLIGSGPLKNEYDAQIKRLSLEKNIVIKYPLPQEKIVEELSNSSVMVLPCIRADNGDRDVLPNVLKEAMAMKVPVITSDIAEIHELIENKKDGILIPPRDPKKIAESISLIFKNKRLAKKLGENGRKKIEKNFNVKIEAEKLEKSFYYELIKKRCDAMLPQEVYEEISHRAETAQKGNMIEIGASHGGATIHLAEGIRKSNKNSILFSIEKGERGSMVNYGTKEENIKILKDNLKYFNYEKYVKIIPKKVGPGIIDTEKEGPFSLILIDADGCIDRDFRLFYNSLIPGADIIIDDYKDIKKITKTTNPINVLGKKYSTYLFVNYFLEKGLLKREKLIYNTIFFKKPRDIKEPVIFNEEEILKIKKKIIKEFKESSRKT